MPNVYVVNASGHDFSAAHQYGALVPLTRGPVKKNAVNHMHRLLSEKLSGSIAEDYILVTSLTQLNMIAAAIFGQLHGRLNLLLWTGEGYRAETIMLCAQNAQSK